MDEETDSYGKGIGKNQYQIGVNVLPLIPALGRPRQDVMTSEAARAT